MYHHLVHARAQPLDHRARIVEQPHMGLASRKITVGVREKRPGLDRNPQPWHGLLEMSAEEQSGTDQERLLSRPRARGLRRKAISPCSIARSVWPAHSLRKPLMCQPTAKLGLKARARSTSAIIASRSSPTTSTAIASL